MSPRPCSGSDGAPGDGRVDALDDTDWDRCRAEVVLEGEAAECEWDWEERLSASELDGREPFSFEKDFVRVIAPLT